MLRLVSGRIFGFFNDRFNLLPWVAATIAPRGRRLSQAERIAYLRAFPTRESRRRILTLFRDLVEKEDYMTDVEHGLSRLKHLPALTMYGQYDPARLVGWQDRFGRIFPRHRAIVVKGEGHFPHEGAPSEMVAVIRNWWSAVVLQPKIAKTVHT